MPRYRIRYEEPESGGTLTSLVIGAVAGFAVGILVAQKSGGIAGITARVKNRWAELEESAEDEPEPTNAEASHESDFGEELEEEDLEDDEALEDADLDDADLDEDEVHAALEDDVLEAFQADSTLRERAIDISAVGDGLIELSGWVDTDDESHHAAAVARRVDGVESVVNRLAIGQADSAGHASDAQREHGATRRHAADLDTTADEQE
ncbi:MAG TPA: BON domain-containing protein [Gemmatimonadaceae bacterium]|nr:BON domain-containing protein [Gemmatimonadaceae bacterium]